LTAENYSLQKHINIVEKTETSYNMPCWITKFNHCVTDITKNQARQRQWQHNKHT